MTKPEGRRAGVVGSYSINFKREREREREREATSERRKTQKTEKNRCGGWMVCAKKMKMKVKRKRKRKRTTW